MTTGLHVSTAIKRGGQPERAHYGGGVGFQIVTIGVASACDAAQRFRPSIVLGTLSFVEGRRTVMNSAGYAMARC